MNVTLINTSGRIKCFTLPHQSYCKARGRCVCSMLPGRQTRLLPPSLTLAAGTRLEGVDEAVLAVTEVERALRAGDLRIERRPLPTAKPANSETHNRRAGKRRRGDA